MSFDLRGRVAVITGGGGIICSHMSEKLGALGVKIAVLDLNAEAAAKVADSVCAVGGEAIAVRCNVLDRSSVEEAAAAVAEKFGGVDILINGAGGNKPAASTSDTASFFDIPQDALNWVFNLNLTGTILPSQVFGKLMSASGKGSIVNISSMSAFVPLTRIAAYSAAKAGVSNFTQWLAVYMAKEVSPSIRVNAIAPGFLLTEQNRFLLTNPDGSATARGNSVMNKTPMGRYGVPDELVGGVIYLCSDEASFVTGVVLPIDGGFLAFAGV